MSVEYGKFVAEKVALTIAHRFRGNGYKIAFTNGCFDVLHIGHVELFGTVAQQDHILIVGVNSDSSVRRLKGPGRPINPEEHRAKVVSSISFVEAGFVFDDLRVDRLIRLFEPDYWVKGAGDGQYTLDSLDKGEVAAARDVKCEIVLINTGLNVSTTQILQKPKEKG